MMVGEEGITIIITKAMITMETMGKNEHPGASCLRGDSAWRAIRLYHWGAVLPMILATGSSS